jgi:hypothetical protein
VQAVIEKAKARKETHWTTLVTRPIQGNGLLRKYWDTLLMVRGFLSRASKCPWQIISPHLLVFRCFKFDAFERFCFHCAVVTVAIQ